MSDDEYMDEEEYDFEYEDEEDQDDAIVDIENEYYNAKALREESSEEALKAFKQVLDMEDEKSEWGFKALKHSCKLAFKLREFDMVKSMYSQMMTYLNGVVTRNKSEKAINTLLDTAATSSDPSLLFFLYQSTIEALKQAKNERLWFKVNLKLASLHFERRDFASLGAILEILEASLTHEEVDEHRRGTLLLEVYSLKIQMKTETKEAKELKQLYQQALKVRTGIPHPRILGTIRACGGKMYMHEGEWKKAREDFFEAFKAFDEAGSPMRIQCLKYLLIANMLSSGEIDPFEAPEAKPYKSDPEIETMMMLHSAYQKNNIRDFDALLKRKKTSITGDAFTSMYVEEMRRNVRLAALADSARPFCRVSIGYLAQEIGVRKEEAVNLLRVLILDERLKAHIHGKDDMLILDKWYTYIRYIYVAKGLCRLRENSSTAKAAQGLANQLVKIESAVLRRLP